MKQHLRFFPFALAMIGTVILAGEVVRAWLWGHKIEPWVVCIGAGFGFVGYYAISPARALQAFGFIRDSSVQIIGVIRTGRRASDVTVAVQAKETTTVEPAVEPSAPVPNDPKVP